MLAEIELELQQYSRVLKQLNSHYQIKEKCTKDGLLQKLFVSNGQALVKIEPNFFIRANVLPIEHRSLVKAVEDQFQYALSDIPLLA